MYFQVVYIVQIICFDLLITTELHLFFGFFYFICEVWIIILCHDYQNLAPLTEKYQCVQL